MASSFDLVDFLGCAPTGDAFDLFYWLACALRAFCLVVVVGVVCGAFISFCVSMVKSWLERRKRVSELGGVTTLTRTLDYTCGLCQDTMEAGEKVRTLSCDHAFHCGGGGSCLRSVKCARGIDAWLRTGLETTCPLCRELPQPVPPEKQPPLSSPAPSSSASASTSTVDLEAALLTQAHGERQPEASSSAPAPPPAQSPTTTTPDSEEEALLPPPHDKTLAEASSSASAPPPAQSPTTTTPDSEEAVPLLAGEEIQPDA